MCLSVPGQLVAISSFEDNLLARTGKVSFGGVYKEVSLAYVPEARVGDYVLVHVGFAISVVDQDEAKFVFDYLKQT